MMQERRTNIEEQKNSKPTKNSTGASVSTNRAGAVGVCGLIMQGRLSSNQISLGPCVAHILQSNVFMCALHSYSNKGANHPGLSVSVQKYCLWMSSVPGTI